MLNCIDLINLDSQNDPTRSRSRSSIAHLLGNVEENLPSRRVSGIRGNLIYADSHGYTYVQNHVSTNRRLI